MSDSFKNPFPLGYLRKKNILADIFLFIKTIVMSFRGNELKWTRPRFYIYSFPWAGQAYILKNIVPSSDNQKLLSPEKSTFRCRLEFGEVTKPWTKSGIEVY